MTFFEPPPPGEPQPEWRPPPWFGPPGNVIGALLPIRQVLARSGNAVVYLLGLTAFPSGCGIELTVRTRGLEQRHPPWLDPFMFGQRAVRSDSLPDELFRFGVELSDGRRVTTIGAAPPDFGHEPDGPVLQHHGGGGGGSRWDVAYWLWPLPPPGPLTLAVEWPAGGIELTRLELDAGEILSAAARAEILWDDEAGGPTGSGGQWQIA